MRYVPTIHTDKPETLTGLQAGQWINYNGSRCRYMGRCNGTIWIAWGNTATHRFRLFAKAFRA